MYFDFDDYRPDISPVGRAISWREGILLSIIVHLALIIMMILSPRIWPETQSAHPLALQAPDEETQFVFTQPRVDTPAPRPPDRGESSDKDRFSRSPEKPPNPTNPMPFARGNSPERVEEPPSSVARGRGPNPDPSEQTPSETPKTADSQSALQPPRQMARNDRGPSGGLLGDALRNLQRSMQNESFNNQQGGAGEFGPEIQFDTKGVEFGPWIRRFVAQVKRNWFVPYAAMSMQGHVVVTFNVHKDGSLTDLTVVGPCPIDSFNTAAFGALSASNPTQPLPPEYPSEKAFFTVTFFYNETPR